MSRGFRQYQTWRVPFCLCVEFLLISCIVIASALIRFRTRGLQLDIVLRYLLHASLTAFVCQLCMYYVDLYELRVAISPGVLLSKLGRALGAAIAILMVLFYMLPSLRVGRGIFIPGLVLAVCSLIAWRLLYQRLHMLNQFRVNILILGTSDEARKLVREIHNHSSLGYELRGILGKSDDIGKELL